MHPVKDVPPSPVPSLASSVSLSPGRSLSPYRNMSPFSPEVDVDAVPVVHMGRASIGSILDLDGPASDEVGHDSLPCDGSTVAVIAPASRSQETPVEPTASPKSRSLRQRRSSKHKSRRHDKARRRTTPTLNKFQVLKKTELCKFFMRGNCKRDAGTCIDSLFIIDRFGVTLLCASFGFCLDTR